MHTAAELPNSEALTLLIWLYFAFQKARKSVPLPDIFISHPVYEKAANLRLIVWGFRVLETFLLHCSFVVVTVQDGFYGFRFFRFCVF
jgi:hypothetical protein